MIRGNPMTQESLIFKNHQSQRPWCESCVTLKVEAKVEAMPFLAQDILYLDKLGFVWIYRVYRGIPLMKQAFNRDNDHWPLGLGVHLDMFFWLTDIVLR